MKQLVLFFLVFTSFFNLLGQEGGFFLSHYTSTDENINSDNFDIEQNEDGILCIANRSGLLFFDGKNWDLVNTPGSLFAIEISDKNHIYTAGLSGLGEISLDNTNHLQYKPLSDSPVQNVFALEYHNGLLYAISNKNLYIYDPNAHQLRTLDFNYGEELLSLHTINQDIYVNTRSVGLKQIRDGQFKDPEISALQRIDISVISDNNGLQQHLIATVDGDLELYRNGSFKKLNIANNDGYLSSNIITEARWANDSLVALATLKGGVALVNTNSKKITEILNYKSGLPDDEIYAIQVDESGGLWIAHQDGLTRVSLSFPLRNYSIYPGLEGNLLSAQYFKGNLYVGTTKGLFYLKETERYNEQQVKIRASSTVPENKEAKATGRKGLFSFLKRNKNGYAPAHNGTKWIYKTEKVLQGVTYEFTRIGSLSSKVNLLSVVKNKLYCGGLDGLYEVKNNKVVAISNAPIRYFYVSGHHQLIFVNTIDDHFEVYNIASETPERTAFLNGFSDYVSNIFEDNDHRVWFCSNNEIYYIKPGADEIIKGKEYNIDNPYFYDTYGTSKNDSLFFINESGLFTLNAASGEIKYLKGENFVESYLPLSNGGLLVYGNEQWQKVGASGKNTENNILNLFNELRYISPGNASGAYWVLTKRNQLYQVSIVADNEDITTTHKLFLKQITIGEEIIVETSKLKFEQESGDITFEFIQPEYSGVVDIKYSYKIEGLDEEWSDWGPNNNTVDIAYLPDGKYKLKMRSQSMLNGIQQAKPIAFKVLAPYWKRPWFLALEFLAVGIILFVSVRLKRLGYRYRMVSRLLALLTLITIIEFLQTLGENRLGTHTSPVIDFIIQILIAIIILPVEGLLRKFIFREKDVQILEYFKMKK